MPDVLLKSKRRTRSFLMGASVESLPVKRETEGTTDQSYEVDPKSGAPMEYLQLENVSDHSVELHVPGADPQTYSLGPGQKLRIGGTGAAPDPPKGIPSSIRKTVVDSRGHTITSLDRIDEAKCEHKRGQEGRDGVVCVDCGRVTSWDDWVE